MNSSDSAEEFVKICLDGIDHAIRIMGVGAKNIGAMLIALSKEKKQTKGKTRLTNMLKTGKPLQIFTIKAEDLKKFSQEAKKYGILYCALANKKNSKIDGMVDILVRDEDSPKINRISLVILEKQPNATQIKDKASWNEKGIELNSGAKGINILEPKVSNNITYYNPKTVYDISETNSKEIKQTINYGDRLLLEALLHNCTVPRKAVEQLPNGTIGSEYDKDNNILYVCKNMDRETLFQTLSQEMGNIELLNEEDSNMKNFISYCTSYMICKKYGIDVSNFNFDNLPQEISSQEDGKGIRKELEKIRSTFEKVNSRMLDYFDMNNKDKNKSIPER